MITPRKFLLGLALVAALAVPGTALAAPGATSPAVARQLAAVRQATEQYHDPAVAAAAGYLQTDECVALPGVGGMGYHYLNPGRMGQLDTLRPDILLYAPGADGPRLTGVEYFFPVIYQRPDGSSGPWFDRTSPPPADWMPAPAPVLFGQTFDGPMPGHVAGMPWHYDLHVWLWQANPAGIFAEWNPNIRCGR